MLGKSQVLVNPKYDGNRVFAFSDSWPGASPNRELMMASRHNGVYQEKDYPTIFKDFALPPKTILDGELLEKQDKVVFWDVLYLEGEDLRFKTLAQRLVALSGAFLRRGVHVELAPAWPVGSAKEVLGLYEKSIKLGYEGVVVKDPGAIYGTSNSWLKMKKYVTDDLVVIKGHDTESSSQTGHFVSWTLGAFDEKHQLVEVVDAYANKAEVSGKVKPGDVVEVRHQPTKGFKRLRHPTILRIRTDKTPEECLLSQVKFERGE